MTTEFKYRAKTERRRARVFKYAKKHGSITNAKAGEIGNWGQPAFHLKIMRQRGFLKKAGWGRWVVATRKQTYQPLI